MSGENFTNSNGGIRSTEIFGGKDRAPRRPRPAMTIKEAARETPVFAETDVLVVGGGPAGTSAAIAAGRLGADVTLVERYNHLGGLSTGGLVLCFLCVGKGSPGAVSGLHPPFLFLARSESLRRMRLL